MTRIAFFVVLLAALAPAGALAQDDGGFGGYFANTAQPGFEDPLSDDDAALAAAAEALANIAPAAGGEEAPGPEAGEALNALEPAAGDEDVPAMDAGEVQKLKADPLSYTP